MGDSAVERATLWAQRPDAGALVEPPDVFGGLGRALASHLEPELEPVRLPGGATLFREGDPGDSFYIVINGRLRVTTKTHGGGERIIDDIGRGELVGDMAVLTGERRSATVRAIRDTELLRCSRAGFERLMERRPDLLRELARVIVGRLERAIHDRPVRKGVATVALLPGSGGALPLEFTERLIEGLGRYGSTRRLSAADVDLALGDGVAQAPCSEGGPSRLVAWLTDQELHHQIVVYEGDPAPSSWNERCLRQADRVLILGSAAAAPTLLPTVTAPPWPESSVRRELVLVHPASSTQPVATSRWLDEASFVAHHHIRDSDGGDYNRLARALTGRSVGVVLGGGGARGFAHIGVLLALEEARIPVDHIGGSSMGAVIAAQYALGWSPGTLRERNRALWVRARPLNDYTVPVVSLIRGRKVLAMLEEMFGSTRIEDTWLPCFCVSSNLTRAEVAVHRRGRLARWVAASMSVPGIGPPVSEQGDLFVDGGVLNNLPVDVMRQLCTGPVIAVDVSPRIDPTLKHSHGIRRGWLWRLINPLADPTTVPNILDILLRATSLGIVHTADIVRREADLYIAPPVEEFGMFDWKAIDRLVDLGYRSAQSAIAQWERKPQPDLA